MYTAFANRFWNKNNDTEQETDNKPSWEQQTEYTTNYIPKSYYLRNEPIPSTKQFTETNYDDDSPINEDQIGSAFLSFPTKQRTLIPKAQPIPKPQFDFSSPIPQKIENNSDDSDFDPNFHYSDNFHYAGYLSFPKSSNFSTEVQTGFNSFNDNASDTFNDNQYNFPESNLNFQGDSSQYENKKKSVQFIPSSTKQDNSFEPSTPPKSILKKRLANSETSPITTNFQSDPNPIPTQFDSNPIFNQFNSIPNQSTNQFNQMPTQFDSNPFNNQFNPMPTQFDSNPITNQFNSISNQMPTQYESNPFTNQFNSIPNQSTNQFNQIPNQFESNPFSNQLTNQFENNPIVNQFSGPFPKYEHNSYPNIQNSYGNTSDVQQMPFPSFNSYGNQQYQGELGNFSGMQQNPVENDFLVINHPKFEASIDNGDRQNEIGTMIGNVGSLFSTPRTVQKVQYSNQNQNQLRNVFGQFNRNGQNRKPLEVINSSFFDPS